MVDFGAETTTVTIYKNNLMRYMTVIPLGGNAITKDLTTLLIEEDEAEQIKLNYKPAEGEEDSEKSIKLLDGRTVLAAQISDIIESRVEEIVANVWNQIQLSGYEDKLLQGVVFTGGACKLPGLEEAFKKASAIEKVRKALSAQQRLEGINASINKDGNTNALIGLLCLGNDNCWKPEPQPEIKPVPQEEPKTGDMFAEDEDLKRQEEEARRARAEQEAAEKRRREEEEKRRKKEAKAAEKKNKKNWFADTLGKITNELFAEEDNLTDDTTK